ncbi:MAG TPA: hypothetical protein VGO50_16175 [Pyrinomonadaceae bacterium]|jgi:hypothetical protein|nr:hypothetical protein [Pyrinomonadaceae bacterium]
MANFGVYFEITNNTGRDLSYVGSDLDDATYDGPQTIPSNNQPTEVHLDDPHFSEGASGTVYFIVQMKGVIRKYAWYGSCPVGSDNSASGPGITNWTGPRGHPTYINIYIDGNTPGWTALGADSPTHKEIKAAAAGKTPADPKKMVKFKQPKTKK